VWNLAVEQHGWWHSGRTAGSQTVQQQALRDFAQAMSDFFKGTHGRPSWRKAGRDEGLIPRSPASGAVRAGGR
jgi:putative transposase